MQKRLIWILFACLAGVPLLAQGVENDQQFDDWQRQLNRDLDSLARKAGLPPGEEVTWDFEVCIDGEIANVGFLIVGRAAGGVILSQNFIVATGRDCKTSTDFNGIDQSNAQSMKDLENFLRETNRPKFTTHSVGVPTTQLLPPLRNIPFLPSYAASAYPTPPPCDPASSPDILIVNHQQNTLTRENGCNASGVVTIRVGSNPLQVAATPDGTLAVVASFDNAITFIDTATNTPTILQTPTNINPSGIAIHPDGTYAYVTSYNDFGSALLKVDLAQRKIVQTLPLGAYPQAVFFNPDGSQAYVTFPFTQSLDIIDTLTTTVAKIVSLPGPAFGVAFNSTATRAYITCRTVPGTVQIFDTATYKILQAITVGAQPVDIVVTGDDQLIFVNNFDSQSMSMIDPVSFAVTNVSLPGRPRGLVQVP